MADASPQVLRASTSKVRCTDGVELAVTETGPRDRPTVLCVHGYPDNGSVWDGVVEQLRDRFHVVTYDVRGAGASDKPSRRRDYRIEQLAADLAAVADAASPNQPVHLLAHDWGAVQAWESVTDRRMAGRIASYTSISGPSLDQTGVWLRAHLRPEVAGLRQLTVQAVESTYLMLFHLPRLPELFWRSRIGDRLLAAVVPAEVERNLADRVNGLELYRANIVRRLARPRPRRTAVPVQVLAPLGDRFVSAALQTQAPVPYVTHLSTRTIEGGHWVVVDQPALVARLTAEFVEQHAEAK